jgi:hypothetical protein
VGPSALALVGLLAGMAAITAAPGTADDGAGTYAPTVATTSPEPSSLGQTSAAITTSPHRRVSRTPPPSDTATPVTPTPSGPDGSPTPSATIPTAPMGSSGPTAVPPYAPATPTATASGGGALAPRPGRSGIDRRGTDRGQPAAPQPVAPERNRPTGGVGTSWMSHLPSPETGLKIFAAGLLALVVAIGGLAAMALRRREY